jgi:hypothetical protein
LVLFAKKAKEGYKCTKYKGERRKEKVKSRSEAETPSEAFRFAPYYFLSLRGDEKIGSFYLLK